MKFYGDSVARRREFQSSSPRGVFPSPWVPALVRAAPAGRRRPPKATAASVVLVPPTSCLAFSFLFSLPLYFYCKVDLEF